MKFIKWTIVVLMTLALYALPTVFMANWAIEKLTGPKFLLWFYVTCFMWKGVADIVDAFKKWFDSKLK